jgi:hypothetical protein
MYVVISCHLFTERATQMPQPTMEELNAKIEAMNLALAREVEAREAAEAGREAAEAGRKAAEAGREAAEAGREAAEAGREAAEAGQRKEREAREAAQRDKFCSDMRGIGSSSSTGTNSRSDEARRGAPPPVEIPLEGFFGDSALAGDANEKTAATAMWAAFKTAHGNEWTPPEAGTFTENKHVHPTIGCLLRTLVPSYLRLWCNETAVDGTAKAEIKPDFTFSHVRDVMPSLLGGVLFVEVKRPGNIDNAVQQAIIYLRRRVWMMYSESLARGVSHLSLHFLHAYALATDGAEVVFVRVRSGVPREPSEYAAAVPCPADTSPKLTLLGSWDFVTQPTFPEDPPHAFQVLLQLLNKPEVLLGPDVPLTQLSATVVLEEGARGSGANLPAAAVLLHFSLESRLGLGGTSDAYACVGIENGGEEGEGGGGGGG